MKVAIKISKSFAHDLRLWDETANRARARGMRFGSPDDTLREIVLAAIEKQKEGK